MKPILDIAKQLGLSEDDLDLYGKFKAKIRRPLPVLGHARGKLVLVTAITPTPAGEGKTTISVGLAQALQKLNQKVCLALREPSMGPVFGAKGGGTGGGLSRLEPSDDINLHFTGDMHAVTYAHNLLAAAIDNHVLFGNALRIDHTQPGWKRVLDMNDRALRQMIVGLGGRKNGGIPREASFDITAASEIMAILCLAEDFADLRKRLNNIVIGVNLDGNFVRAGELGVANAMVALLKDAMYPNLVQSTEGVPAIVHGGPFANIAQGTNSVIATKTALSLADIAITEAGFAFDLGGEKFMDIKCRAAGLHPEVTVLVATIRALKHHAGCPADKLTTPDVDAVERGCVNLGKHIENVAQFGIPAVVAINHFPTDTDAEIRAVQQYCAQHGVKAAPARIFTEGGAGGKELAEAVLAALHKGGAAFKPLYDLHDPVDQKIFTVARKIYGAEGVTFSPVALAMLSKLKKQGLDHLAICMAKTQYSFSDNPKLLARPENFTLNVREVEIAAGAGFIVAITGELVRMPGLPKAPNFARFEVDDSGKLLKM